MAARRMSSAALPDDVFRPAVRAGEDAQRA